MFRQDCSHHLLTTILPFWENLTDWERGGWFGYVNHDLSVERGAHKGLHPQQPHSVDVLDGGARDGR